MWDQQLLGDAVLLGQLLHGSALIGIAQHAVDVLRQIGALAAADAVLLLGEPVGVGEIGVAGPLTDHGPGHQQIDDGGVGGAGGHLHQGGGLILQRGDLPALLQSDLFTGGAALHGVGQDLFVGVLASAVVLLAAGGQQGGADGQCQRQTQKLLDLFHGNILLDMVHGCVVTDVLCLFCVRW